MDFQSDCEFFCFENFVSLIILSYHLTTCSTETYVSHCENSLRPKRSLGWTDKWMEDCWSFNSYLLWTDEKKTVRFTVLCTTICFYFDKQKQPFKEHEKTGQKNYGIVRENLQSVRNWIQVLCITLTLKRRPIILENLTYVRHVCFSH